MRAIVKVKRKGLIARRVRKLFDDLTVALNYAREQYDDPRVEWVEVFEIPN